MTTLLLVLTLVPFPFQQISFGVKELAKLFDQGVLLTVVIASWISLVIVFREWLKAQAKIVEMANKYAQLSEGQAKAVDTFDRALSLVARRRDEED